MRRSGGVSISKFPSRQAQCHTAPPPFVLRIPVEAGWATAADHRHPVRCARAEKDKLILKIAVDLQRGHGREREGGEAGIGMKDKGCRMKDWADEGSDGWEDGIEVFLGKEGLFTETEWNPCYRKNGINSVLRIGVCSLAIPFQPFLTPRIIMSKLPRRHIVALTDGSSKTGPSSCAGWAPREYLDQVLIQSFGGRDRRDKPAACLVGSSLGTCFKASLETSFRLSAGDIMEEVLSQIWDAVGDIFGGMGRGSNGR